MKMLYPGLDRTSTAVACMGYIRRAVRFPPLLIFLFILAGCGVQESFTVHETPKPLSCAVFTDTRWKNFSFGVDSPSDVTASVVDAWEIGQDQFQFQNLYDGSLQLDWEGSDSARSMTYSASFDKDRRLEHVDVSWSSPATLTQVLDCLGNPRLYSANYGPGHHEAILYIDLWYPDRGYSLHQSFYTRVTPLHPVEPALRIDAFRVSAQTRPEQMVSSIHTPGAYPLFTAASLCQLRPWPGRLEAVEARYEDTRCNLTAPPFHSVSLQSLPEPEAEQDSEKLLWRYTTSGAVHSSPTVAKGVLYVGSMDGFLYALDATTGMLRWRFATGHGFISSPAVAGGIVYVGSNEGHLYALDAASGDLLWRSATDGPVYSSPAVAGDMVFVGSMDGYLYALDSATGKRRWRYAVGSRYSSSRKIGLLSSPTVSEGHVYIGTMEGLLVLDAVSGERIWSYDQNWRRTLPRSEATVYSAPNEVSSSPALANGMVYFGSLDGHLYAVDAAGGEHRWNVALSTTERNDEFGFSTAWTANFHSSPLVVDGILYVGSGLNHVYALDAGSGQIHWQYTTDHVVNSSPALAEGVVYIGSDDGHLYALDASNGQLLWRHKTNGPVLSSPTAAGGVVYVGSADGNIYALSAAAPASPPPETTQPIAQETTAQESSPTSPDPQSRSERMLPHPLWKFEEYSGHSTTPSVIADGLAYIGYDSTLYALDVDSGLPVWNYDMGSGVVSPPAVGDGLVFFGTSHHEDHVYALDAATGKVRWGYESGYRIDSPPAVADGVVYFGADDGHVYALNIATGERIWRYFTAGPVDSSPTVVEDVVYVGSGDGRLHALQAATGGLLWRARIGGMQGSTPAVAEGVVYIGSLDGRLHALDADNGELLWRYNTELKVDSSPAVEDGLVFFAPEDGYLYALDAATGDLIWRQFTNSYSSRSGQSSSPTAANGVVYIGSSYGLLMALDAATGDWLWQHRVGSQPVFFTTVDDNRIYAGSDLVYALEIRPLRPKAPDSPILWRYQPDGPEYTSEGRPMRLARALIGGTVYVGAPEGHIHALHAATGERLWSYLAGGNVYTSPAQSGGVVFFGSEDGNLYALDAARGNLLWQYESDHPVYQVLAEEGIVYFNTEAGGIYAVDSSTGIAIWQKKLDFDLAYLGDMDKNALYAYSWADLYALDPATGDLKWSYTAEDRLKAFTAKEGVIYFTTSDDHLFALDAATGQLLWQKSTGGTVSAAPVVADDVVYVASHDGHFYAFAVDTGDELWRHDALTYIFSSPLVVNGVLYGGAYQGPLFALDAKTGVEHWRYSEGSGVSGPPLFLDGVVYFGSNWNSIFGVDSVTGEELFRHESGSDVMSFLTAGESVIYAFYDNGDVNAFRPDIAITRQQKRLRTEREE